MQQSFANDTTLKTEDLSAIAESQVKSSSAQLSLPLAYLNGEAIIEKPTDLYIPPDALEVILESFSGPLDFLLYLIRRQKLAITELAIQTITEQYMQYVDILKDMRLSLAADYLVMAATLAEIKSRALLPKPESVEDSEDDPRVELIRRLQEYQQIQQAAQTLDEIPRYERDFFIAQVAQLPNQKDVPLPEVDLQDLYSALNEVMQRAKAFQTHEIKAESLSTRERMSAILRVLQQTDEFVVFSELFSQEEGKAGVVVTFLAILELTKNQLIYLSYGEQKQQIYVKLGESQV